MRKFDMNILHICPPYLSDVATFPWEIQKSFLTVLLLSASHCLHSPIMSGACYRSACVEYQSMIPTSCGRGLLRDAIEQWQKTGSMYSCRMWSL